MQSRYEPCQNGEGSQHQPPLPLQSNKSKQWIIQNRRRRFSSAVQQFVSKCPFKWFLLCSTIMWEFDFSVRKSSYSLDLMSSWTSRLSSSISDFYFCPFIILSRKWLEWVKYFVTAGNLTNISYLDYEAGISTLMVSVGPLYFWPVLHTILLSLPPCSCGFIIATLLKI